MPGMSADLLDPAAADAFAAWFGTLADPTRVRLLHAVATASSVRLRVGDLAAALEISQSTASHHVRRLAEAGLVAVDRVGNTTVVSVSPAGCEGVPHAADVVLGEVVRRTEPDMALVPCFEPIGAPCAITPACILRRALHEARSAFLAVLDGYTLADLIKNRSMLSELLAREAPRPGEPVPAG